MSVSRILSKHIEQSYTNNDDKLEVAAFVCGNAGMDEECGSDTESSLVGEELD
jgi:hypothetical protein